MPSMFLIPLSRRQEPDMTTRLRKDSQAITGISRVLFPDAKRDPV